jgi:Silicon transporter
VKKNLQCFIDGRQFLVLVIVFLIRWLTESVNDAAVLGLPEIVIDIFLRWGLAVILIWLGMMEGGQRCLVGLQGVNPDLYSNSHPRTLKNTRIAHKGDNMERYIVGRQFLVFLVVFVTNMAEVLARHCGHNLCRFRSIFDPFDGNRWPTYRTSECSRLHA